MMYFIYQQHPTVFFIGRLEEAGGWVKIKANKCYLMNKNDQVIAEGVRTNRMYPLDVQVELGGEAVQTAGEPLPSWDEWHRHLEHTSISTITEMTKSGAVTGMEIDKATKPSPTCEPCI